MTILSTTLRRAAIVAVAVAGLGTAADAAEISGAGATFPYPIYAKWAEAFQAKTGHKLNYQSIGSGGGIRQIKAKTVNFGATDAPLTGQELDEAGLVQFPMVMGGVVPVVNIRGVEPGQLKLTGPLLANIYLGKVKTWNDPAIAQLNPGLSLPAQAIAVVQRSDGSGTTFLFTDYLSKVSEEWKTKVGSKTAVSWPTGLGGKGNEGVAALAVRTAGAIGYVEYAYAKQNKMSYALMQNAEGRFVAPELKSFQAAAAGADWKSVPGFGVVLTQQKGADSWPLTGATFILMYKQQAKPEAAKIVLDFFDWAYRQGSGLAEGLDYVPMPASVVQQVEAMWAQEVKGAGGQPVWRPSGS